MIIVLGSLYRKVVLDCLRAVLEWERRVWCSEPADCISEEGRRSGRNLACARLVGKTGVERVEDVAFEAEALSVRTRRLEDRLFRLARLADRRGCVVRRDVVLGRATRLGLC
jgi:hypothetical protein